MGAVVDPREPFIQRLRDYFGPGDLGCDGVPFEKMSLSNLRRKCRELEELAGYCPVREPNFGAPKRKPMPVFRPPIGRRRTNNYGLRSVR